MNRVIAFSLFGSGETYCRGMVANARLAPVVYPGWRIVVFCDDQITCADELRSLGCELVPMPRVSGAKAMCWRFLPLADASIERAIVRDADSRLSDREAAAVAAWIEAGTTFHLMRDHEHHRCFPIFAGMFGGLGGSLPLMQSWIDAWPSWGERMDDMHLLNQYAWPIMQRSVTHHTSVENQWGGEPFPSHEPCPGFVGQQYGADQP